MPQVFGEVVGVMDKLDTMVMTATVPPDPHAATESTISYEQIELAEGKARMSTVSNADGSAYVSTVTKAKFLAIYFVFNLGLTLFNKAIMIEFPFPFLLTALHAAAGCIGTGIMHSWGTFKPKTLSRRDSLALYAFSVLYTINIAVSNVSLSMVTVPFHQVLRATTPVFTVAIYRICYSNTYNFDTYLSLIPVIIGVGLATYGDYYATVLGFFMTLFGAVLAAVKTVATNRMQTAGLRLSAIELLFRLSPLALFQSIAMAYFNGEFSAVQPLLCKPCKLSITVLPVLLANAAMSFGLNLASFTANKKAGALTMNVAANVKQILSMLLAVLFWDLRVGSINALGIAITLVGGAWYAHVEMMGHKNGQESQVTRMEEGRLGDLSAQGEDTKRTYWYT